MVTSITKLKKIRDKIKKHLNEFFEEHPEISVIALEYYGIEAFTGASIQKEFEKNYTDTNIYNLDDEKHVIEVIENIVCNGLESIDVESGYPELYKWVDEYGDEIWKIQNYKDNFYLIYVSPVFLRT